MSLAIGGRVGHIVKGLYGRLHWSDVFSKAPSITKSTSHRFSTTSRIYSCSDISKLNVNTTGETLTVEWKDGKCSNYNSMWLRFNCSCPKCKDSSTNMTRYDLTTIPMDMTLKASKSAVILYSGVSITWNEENHQYVFDQAYLKKYCNSKTSLEEKRKEIKPIPNIKKTVDKVHYDDVMGSDKGLYKWLRIINEDGICLMEGVPPADGESIKVMNLIGELQSTIYGTVYDIIQEEKPLNLAYTSEFLSKHMDLQQYASPPGIQFLHCIEFDDWIKGGETTFVDMYAIAEEFRRLHPEHFQVLSRMPYTFERHHTSRDNPAAMEIRRPIITTNHYGEIIGIHWHINIQGPLIADEAYVGPFYKAYQVFGDMVNHAKSEKVIRYKVGDMVGYNNRRMSHGRNAFDLESRGKRWLQGAYVNIDEYKSRLMVLANALGDDTPVKCVFNNDWL